MLGLFADRPLVDEHSAQVLDELYAWAERGLAAREADSSPQLLEPTNEFFPGRADTLEGMANLIFERVRRYAGMQAWSLHLVNQLEWEEQSESTAEQAGAQGNLALQSTSAPSQPVPYHTDQVTQPESLIAALAHTLAHYLATSFTEPLPGGEARRAQATETLAVAMGFGLMFANTAFEAPAGGCGSCRRPGAARQSFLTEQDLLYLLARFVRAHRINPDGLRRHLKRPLRSQLRGALKQAELRGH